MLFKLGFVLYFIFETSNKYKEGFQAALTNITTVLPTAFPTRKSIVFPTKFPSQLPTKFPTALPSQESIELPTQSPTKFPTALPTQSPTKFPTQAPTIFTYMSFSVPGSVRTEIQASSSNYAVGTYFIPSSNSPHAFIYKYSDGSYEDLYVPGNEVPGWGDPFSLGTDIVGDIAYFDTAWRKTFSKNIKTGVVTSIHPNEYPGYPDASITRVDKLNPQKYVGHYDERGIVNSFYTDGTSFIQLKGPGIISYFAKGLYNGNVVGITGYSWEGKVPPENRVGWFWNGQKFLEGGIRLPASFGSFDYCGAYDIYDDYIIGNCDSTPFLYQISSGNYKVITSNIPNAIITVTSVTLSSSQEIIVTGSYKYDNTDVIGFRAVLDNKYSFVISGSNSKANTNRKLVADNDDLKNNPIKTSYLRKRMISLKKHISDFA